MSVSSASIQNGFKIFDAIISPFTGHALVKEYIRNLLNTTLINTIRTNF